MFRVLTVAQLTLAIAALVCVGCTLAGASDNLLMDVSARTGIDFHHSTGAFVTLDGKASRYMPETMGAGVALFDYDRDGDSDILLVNSAGFDGIAQSIGGTPRLYRNDGNWRFSDITTAVGLNVALYGMGAAIADYDGDADADILMTTLGGVRLFRNDFGRFKDVTAAVGFAPAIWIDQRGNSGIEWTTAAAWFDVDGDLDLDLLAVNYLRWSPTADIFVTSDTVNKGYASPRSYEAQRLRLWLQEDGFFIDATEKSGFAMAGKGLGIALWDFDRDRQLDVMVANDTMENFLFRNLGGGKFMNIAAQAEVAFDANGNTRAGMGIDIADYLNNGSAAIAIGNFSKEPTSFFRQQEAWRFAEDSKQTGIAAATLPLLTFGVLFADVDLDGWQDLLTANGHVEPGIATIWPDEKYRQPLQWLQNMGDGNFVDRSIAIQALATPMVGRGLAVADLDGDGDLDMVATSNGGAPRIIKNNVSRQSYLRVQLTGLPPNTDAIGARIILLGERMQQQRIVRTGSSYLSQSELIQTFGLAKQEPVHTLIVEWPNGDKTIIANPEINRTLPLKQPE